MNKIKIMEAAVRKWNRILDDNGRDGGVLDCPPCRIFYVLVCTGCPIATYSGHKFCKRTPYGPWFHHQTDEHGYLTRKIYCPECRRLATAMRDYMQEIVDHLKAQQSVQQESQGREPASE